MIYVSEYRDMLKILSEAQYQIEEKAEHEYRANNPRPQHEDTDPPETQHPTLTEWYDGLENTKHSNVEWLRLEALRIKVLDQAVNCIAKDVEREAAK